MARRKKPKLITQSEAAEIAGVSRQTLNAAFKRGTFKYSFFSQDGHIDINHPHWKLYLDEKKGTGNQEIISGIKPAKKKKIVKSTKKTQDKMSKKKIVEELKKHTPVEEHESIDKIVDIIPGIENTLLESQNKLLAEREKEIAKIEKEEKKKKTWNRKNSLTGGYDPSMFVPTNPSQLKALTDIAAKSLEMRIKLGEYIHRDIVDSYIDKISKEINQFVYLGRSISKRVCEKLDRIGMEKEFEKIINKEVEEIIERIINVCQKIKK